MKNDMTQGNEAKALIFFALPMVLGNLFQQLYNIIDSMVVGNFVGSNALAAVGASTSVCFLFVAIATGISIGCSVIISQLFGAKQIAKMKTAISTSLIFIFAISTVLTVVGLIFSPAILKFMQTPEEILTDASTYLSIYFAGLIFLFLYNGMTAVYNGLGKSKIPLVFLAFSSVLNVGLDLLFVIRFHMGVAGVAWATLISQAASSIISFIFLLHVLKNIESNENKNTVFDKGLLKHMLAVAIPSCLQQSIVSLGFLGVQALVNGYGAVVIAGYTAASKIDSIAIMPMVSVGNAVSTFTAQNMGAKKTERVKSGYRAGLLMSAGISLTVTLVLYLFGSQLIGAFVDSAANQDVIAVGVEYLRTVSLFYIVMGFMNNTNGVLRGSGDMKIFMAVTLCNFGTRVIMAYALAATPLGKSAVWWAIPLGWAVGLVISLVRFLSGKWKKLSLV